MYLILDPLRKAPWNLYDVRERRTTEEQMAEAMFLVCDYCGKDAVDTLMIRIGQQNYLLDVCDRHLKAITSKARKPKRGRRPKSSSTASA
jgi:hypothetical protein